MSILGRVFNPYPNGNSTTIADFLEQLVLLVSHEIGSIPITGNEGYQDVPISNEVISLNVPENAVSATIFIEGSNNSNNALIRYKENGGDPTVNSGFEFYHRDIIRRSGRETLKQIRIIGLSNDSNSFLRIQFDKTAQKTENDIN